MKNILLPTDFSDNSINAIHYAINFFRDIDCTFFLLNIYRIPYVAPDQELTYFDHDNVARMEVELFNSSQNDLKKTVEQFKDRVSPNHKFEMISDYNFFINSVENYVKEKKIDLIVMGTKGATGAKEIFMGSNTGDVIMKTKCNVLAVPENSIYQKPIEITFPTDFRIPYKKEDLDQLVEISKMHQSNIRILLFDKKGVLDEEQKFNKKALNKIFDQVTHSYYTITNIDFEEALNCFTQSRGDVNLIAIIAKHYNFFQRLFFKPKVQELSFHSNIPLLVLHKTKK
ncbi:MAG: universal stress protein [Bacteroidota bacterium]